MRSFNKKSYKPLNIRHENIKQLIKLLKNSERKLSRADIARELSLSTPSVSSIVNVLIDSEIIIETDDESKAKNVGRKPILLKLNENCGYILGVLISQEKIKIVLANYIGKIITEKDFYYQDSDRKSLDLLTESIDKQLKEFKINHNKLLSISISFPGVYDQDKQEIKFAPNSGGWQNKPIIKTLSQEYECQIKMENNVNTAVLGEKWKGKIADKNNAIYLKIGNGIASGIIINKELYRGYNCLAGEVGFSVTDSDQLNDKIIDSGSFEQRFNTDNFIKKIQKEFNITAGSFSEIKKELSLKSEFNEFIRNINTNIAMLLINMSSILNPEVIVIGGEYTELIIDYICELENQVKKNVPFASEILVSDLGEKVYVLGSIANSIQGLERQLIRKYFME